MTDAELLENFNPLPPHGGRRVPQLKTVRSYKFQSTPSAWRETGWQDLVGDPFPISIHSLRMEGDLGLTTQNTAHHRFQSTPSAWRETYGHYMAMSTMEFQSTPSAWRETYRHRYLHGSISNFNPLPPHGGRLSPFFIIFLPYPLFQSTRIIDSYNRF